MAIGCLLLAPAAACPLGAQDGWLLAEEPDPVIGSVGGQPTLTLHDVRGAVVVPDGSIVVADGGTRRLRVFAPSGAFVREFGGRGDGPEEFRSIGWIDRCGGDAVVAFDPIRSRITRWDPAGLLLEGFRVQGTHPDRPAHRVACSPEGGFAVMGWPDVLAHPGGEGPYRLEVQVGILDERGNLVQAVGKFPGPERYRYTNNDGPRPLGRSTILRIGADGVYVGTADSLRIVVVDPGGIRRSIGTGEPPRRMTSGLLRTWHDSVVEGFPAHMRAEARRGLGQHESPTVLPAYSDFRIDPLGFVWVTRYPAPGQRHADLEVFGPDGHIAASFRIPVRFRLTDVGEDHLLGVVTDSLGVERIHRYALSRPR